MLISCLIVCSYVYTTSNNERMQLSMLLARIRSRAHQRPCRHHHNVSKCHVDFKLFTTSRQTVGCSHARAELCTRHYQNVLVIRDTVASLAKTFIRRHTSSVPPNLHTHAPNLNSRCPRFISQQPITEAASLILGYDLCYGYLIVLSLWTFPVSTCTVLLLVFH